jgi:hypothetical protein
VSSTMWRKTCQTNLALALRIFPNAQRRIDGEVGEQENPSTTIQAKARNSVFSPFVSSFCFFAGGTPVGSRVNGATPPSIPTLGASRKYHVHHSQGGEAEPEGPQWVLGLRGLGSDMGDQPWGSDRNIVPSLPAYLFSAPV